MVRARGYGQFCPVAKAAEIFAERWTPLVLRELLSGSRRFGELQRGLPRISRSLLSQRLRQLEEAGLVHKQRDANGSHGQYILTDAGQELRPVVEALGQWGHRWVSHDLDRDDLDPGLLMWDIRRRIRTDAVPVRRAVIAFELTGAPRGLGRWWLVVDKEQDEVDLCLKNPGFEVQLTVHSDLGVLTDVWLGYTPVSQALRAGTVQLQGAGALRRSFEDWFALSAFANPL
jgi:DNA-binding HxlR family transcriptional regulator